MPAKLLALLALLAALALVPVAAPAHDAPPTRDCGQVGFTPHSDDVAAEIRATGLTCGIARDVVRDSRGRPGATFRGLRCTSTAVDGGTMPFRRFRCTGAGDTIRWQRF